MIVVAATTYAKMVAHNMVENMVGVVVERVNQMIVKNAQEMAHTRV